MDSWRATTRWLCREMVGIRFSTAVVNHGARVAGFRIFARALVSAALLCCLFTVGCRPGKKDQPATSSASASEVEAVVQRGLDAWNKHDIEGALSVFSPDVKIYHFPDQLVPNSLDSIRARWTQRFAKDPKVHVTVSPRIVHNTLVIDHEIVSGLTNGKTRTADWIYEVDGGRIVRAWLLPE
jgi:uncharacterized protein (TIGR02246 family)